MKILSFAFIFCMFLMSCEKKTPIINIEDYVCEFKSNAISGAVEDEENELINESIATKLNSVDAITENLMGLWDLAGFGGGWGMNNSIPCQLYMFEEDKVTIREISSTIDTLFELEWEVIEAQSPNGEIGHFIKFYEDGMPDRSESFTFGKKIMYFDYMPVDGNMKIFQKLE